LAVFLAWGLSMIAGTGVTMQFTPARVRQWKIDPETMKRDLANDDLSGQCRM
jgi:hypothetical protein